MTISEIDTAAFDKAHDLAVHSKKEDDSGFVTALAQFLTDEHEVLHTADTLEPGKFRQRCAEILTELLGSKGIDFLVAKESRRAIRSALETGLAAKGSVRPPSVK